MSTSGEGLGHIILSFIGVFICMGPGLILSNTSAFKFRASLCVKGKLCAHGKLNSVTSLDPWDKANSIFVSPLNWGPRPAKIWGWSLSVISAVEGDQWSDSRPGHLSFEKKPLLSNRWEGGRAWEPVGIQRDLNPGSLKAYSLHWQSYMREGGGELILHRKATHPNI